jgi:hypothetical protein
MIRNTLPRSTTMIVNLNNLERVGYSSFLILINISPSSLLLGINVYVYFLCSLSAYRLCKFMVTAHPAVL